MIPAKQVSGVIRADGSVPFTGNQSFGGFRATNMADPVSAGQGATKNFADTKTLAFGQWQQLQAANTTANRFVMPGGGNNPNATEALSIIVAPAAGFLTGLYVFFGVAMTVCTTTFTVRVNGVNSSIVVAMALAQTQGNIVGQSVAVAAGDRVTILSVQSSAEALATLAAGLRVLWRSSN